MATTPDLERDWWGDCANTLHEEQKQLAYASRMGLVADWECAHPPMFDLAGRSVIDIGGGPASLLLKTVNRGGCVVVDPGDYPAWTAARYAHAGIDVLQIPGEQLTLEGYDEAWIYNTLQHVESPCDVISAARRAARTIRLFEWVGIDPYPGHPHRLDPHELDMWLGGHGYVATIDEAGAVGRAYYGVMSACGRDRLRA